MTAARVRAAPLPAVARDPSGRFRPGRSGNPAGRPVRPPGLGERLAAMAAEQAEAVVRSTIEKALAGDPAAAELVLRLADTAKRTERHG